PANPSSPENHIPPAFGQIYLARCQKNHTL
ncbi:hypothetical protein ABIB73_007154, partial [Bradyrhizobium sp. F1.4.3]